MDAMRVSRELHTPIFVGVCCLSLVFWFSGYAYLCHERDSLEKLRLAGQTHTQEVAWQAVITAHRAAMQAYFESYVMQPEILHILESALVEDREQQNRARVKLYRALSPVYEALRQRGVRQLHFHTPDSRSFLRFHAPHNSGDALDSSRPSVVIANRTLKPVVGFETGRIVIGFRNVFPIVWHGRHLGSVELSQPFEAIRKGLHELDPSKEYLLLLKADILLPKLLDEHKRLYARSHCSQEWLVEDPRHELPDTSPPLSPSAQRVYEQLKDNVRFKAVLASVKPGTIAVRSGDRICQANLIPLHDTDGIQSGLILAFSQSPELAELYRNHQINLLVFTIMTLFGGAALYLFLSSMRTVHAQDQQMALISSNIADGIYVIDGSGKITFTNHRASELLGYTSEEFVGGIAHEMFHLHDGSNKTPLRECPIYNVIQTKGRYEGEEIFAHKDGTLLTVQVASQAMLKGDRVIGSVTVFRDVSEQKQLEEHLRLLSITDPLTGIYNRRFLQEALLKELYRAERHGKPFSVIMFDLDHFKQVNDQWGHEMGDRVLRHVVELVQTRIRNSDLAARWGGEEFTLLLPATDGRDAVALAESLLQLMRETSLEGVGTITASFGVTIWQAGDTVVSLAQRVDDLMYQAKQAGRNCVRSNCV